MLHLYFFPDEEPVEIETAAIGEDCPICLKPVKSVKSAAAYSTCKHIFHSVCLDRYKLHNENQKTFFHLNCPICRQRGGIHGVKIKISRD